jgi:hypothetical protein
MRNYLKKLPNEAPLADAEGIFSPRFVGSKIPPKRNTSLSSASLRSRFFAKGDKKFLGLLVVFLVAVLFRFYNFRERVTFGPEQAISLITSGEMLRGKFSLLGQENVQRATSEGHRIFSGALFSYSLIPEQIALKYDPLAITVYFCILNLATGFFIYLIVKKFHSKRIAFLSLIFFLFSLQMIQHSLFIWILNYLPAVGIFTYYFLRKFQRDKKPANIFWLGVLAGVGFSLEYLYFPLAFITLLWVLYKAPRKVGAFFAFLAGAVIPNLPAVIFDLRNGYYHLLTLAQYFLDVGWGRGAAMLSYYHFLPLWPLFALGLGILADKVFVKNRHFAVLIITGYILLNITPLLDFFDRPGGMPKDLTIGSIKKSAQLIKSDNPSSFNVAVIHDFDTRGHILRYPLIFQYKTVPLGVTDYPNANILYVLAPRGYNFAMSSVWEVSSFGSRKILSMAPVGDSFELFKLTK